MNEISSFLENLGDAVLIVNESSDVVFANSACAKLFGYAQSQMERISLNTLMESKYRNDHIRQAKKFIAANESSRQMMGRGIIPCIDSQGEPFSARVSISSIKLEDKYFGVAIIQDYSSFQEQLLALELDSNVDALTNLYNRRYLDKITGPNSRVLISWEKIGVIYIDLDKFKPVNDIHGHEMGDAVLRSVAHRIKERIRYDDIPFRLGGDEFLIMVNIGGSDNYFNLLDTLCVKLHDEIIQPINMGNSPIAVGVSIGCGVYPDDENDLLRLIHLSDKAMYESKKSDVAVVSVAQLPERAYPIQ